MGFRLPDDTRLGQVVLQVADLARSLGYYQRVLGLEVHSREPRAARLGPVGTADTILELRELAGAVPVPRRGRLGLYHFAILLPGREALGRFVRHLATLGERAGMSDHLVSEAVYLTDPDGLGIEVYADRPRSSWQWADGQLLMATEPMDVVAVVAAGGSLPWTGMPAGTVLGHVHLFVGDLTEASRYYHDGLGLDRMVWSYPGALFLAAGGYHHHLGVNTWAAGAQPAGAGDARLVEWVVEVPGRADADAALASLTASGAAVEPDPAGGGVSRDPWGTAVRVRPASPSAMGAPR